MSTSKTEHIQLNQWAAEDQFLREEFNEDNRKIDQALGQLCYLKLLDVTTDAPAKQVDMDVSHIKFTDYWKLELFLDCPLTGENPLKIWTNQLKSGYESPPCDGNRGGDYGGLLVIPKPGLYPMSFQFCRPAAGVPVAAHGHYFYAENSYGHGYSMNGLSSVTWDRLTTLSLACDQDIPAGTRVVLMGVKR